MFIKDKLLRKENLWHVGAIAIFLLISCLYFSPVFSGHTIKQTDVQNWAGAAQEVIDFRETNGEEPHWTNSMFSGMPSVQISGSYPGLKVIDVLISIVTLGLPRPVNFLFLYFVGFYLLAMSLRVRPVVGILGSIAFSLSSYFIIILEAGHNTKAFAIGFSTFVLAGFIWTFRSKKVLLPIVLSGLFMVFEIRANHPQITYYLGILLVGIGIVEFGKALKASQVMNFVKRTAGLLLIYVLAVLINYGNIKGTLDYTKHTTRGGSELTINPDGSAKVSAGADHGLDIDYITNWSYGIGETFSLIVPNFKGGETQGIGGNLDNKDVLKGVDRKYRSQIVQMNQYWGDQPFVSGPVYLGVIVVFLALLAIFYLDDKLKWALLGVTVLVILLSWGKNFMGLTEFFVEYVPGYAKFRAVTIILSIVSITIAMLGVLFLSKLMKARGEIEKNIKPFLIVSGSFLLLLLVFYAAPNAFNSFLSQGEVAQLNGIEDPKQYDNASLIFGELEQVRIAIFRKDVLRSSLFLVVGIGAVFFGIKNETFVKKGLIPVLAIFILADLLSVNLRYLGKDTKGADAQWVEVWKQKYPFSAGAGDKLIFEQEIQSESVASLINEEIAKTRKQLKAERIKGAQASRIIDHNKYRALSRATHFRVFEQGNPFNSSRASYFHKSVGGYHGAKLGKYQELIEFQISKNNQAVLNMLNTKYLLGPGGSNASPNPGALGNAWFVKSIETVETADDLIQSLNVETDYKMSSFNGFRINSGNNIDSILKVKGNEALSIITPSQESLPLKDVPFQATLQQTIALYSSEEKGMEWGYYNNRVTPNLVLIISAEQQGFDPENKAVLLKEDAKQIERIEFSGNGSIELDSYAPNKLTYSSNSSEDQFAVFSEIYINEGWHATIDNEEADIIPVNYVLRALKVPAGEHTIKFWYEVDSYKRANVISLSLSILLLLLIGGAIYWEYFRSDQSAGPMQ